MFDTASWAQQIRYASPDDFWIWTVILLAVGLACGNGIFYFVRRARIIEDTPTSKVRSASQGYVELIGQVNYFANEAVSAPLTLTPCAWFSFTIERKETSYSSKGSRTYWRKIKTETSDRPFQCVDDTGSCMINPKGAEVHVNQKDVWYGHEKWPTRGPTKRGSGIFSSGSYRYTEKRLQQNEPLYAIGHFRTVDPNKAHGTVSDEMRAILSVWKKDPDNLLAQFDTNQDGEIDLQEWEQVRASAEQKAFQQRLARSDRPAVHVLSNPDDFRRPFILSVKSPNKMVSRFKLKAAACTVGFILAAPVSIWMIFIRLS